VIAAVTRHRSCKRITPGSVADASQGLKSATQTPSRSTARWSGEAVCAVIARHQGEARTAAELCSGLRGTSRRHDTGNRIDAATP